VKVFSAPAILIALNHHDPAICRDRIEALASLVEDFEIELSFDADNFIGIIDLLAPLRVEMAVA